MSHDPVLNQLSKIINDEKIAMINLLESKDYLSFSETTNLVGHKLFGSKWNFEEIKETSHYLKGFFRIYYNIIHLNTEKNPLKFEDNQEKWEFLYIGHKLRFRNFSDYLIVCILLNIDEYKPKFIRIKNRILEQAIYIDKRHPKPKTDIVKFFGEDLLDLSLSTNFEEKIKKLIKPEIISFLRELYQTKASINSFIDDKELIYQFYLLLLKNKNLIKETIYSESFNKISSYFPDKTNKDPLELFEDKYNEIVRFLKVKEFLNNNIFLNQRIECFVKNKNNVKKRIIGFPQEAKINHNHLFFDGIIGKVAILDEFTKTEQIIENCPLYISRESLIKNIENLTKQSEINNIKFQENLSTKETKAETIDAGTNLNQIIQDTVKLLTNINGKHPKSIKVWQDIKKNQKDYLEIIVKMSNNYEIEWIVANTAEIKTMKKKTFQNLVSQFKIK